MKGEFSLNEDFHLKDLDHFMHYYNNKRYPTNHYGYTVLQVLHGKIPDKKRFKNEIKLAQQQRYQENKSFNQCFFQFC
jgi:hypothetical protein